MKRISRVAVTAVMAGGLVGALGTQPAHAGNCTWNTFCGTVSNQLSGSYTVKIAEFGTGTERCPTVNAGTMTCKTYWLPSGETSTGIGVKDADGVMIESTWIYDNSSDPISAYRWVKFGDFTSVVCQWAGYPHPYCRGA